MSFVHAFDRQPRVTLRFRVYILQRCAERNAGGIGLRRALAQHEVDQVFTKFDPLGRRVRHVGQIVENKIFVFVKSDDQVAVKRIK